MPHMTDCQPSRYTFPDPPGLGPVQTLFQPDTNPILLRQQKCLRMTQFSSGIVKKALLGSLQMLDLLSRAKIWNSFHNLSWIRPSIRPTLNTFHLEEFLSFASIVNFCHWPLPQRCQQCLGNLSWNGTANMLQYCTDYQVVPGTVLYRSAWVPGRSVAYYVSPCMASDMYSFAWIHYCQ